MPEIFAINTFLFQDLLRDFQIIAAPRSPVWYLSDTVIPVSLVNSQVTLDAIISETAMQFATEGEQTAPVAGALLADTGQLDAGRHLFRVFHASFDNGLTQRIRVEHRDAANTGNIWTQFFTSNTTNALNVGMEWVEEVAQDERVRIAVVLTSTAAMLYNAIIWRRKLS